MNTRQFAYQFFVSSFVIESDDPDFLSDFERIYQPFRIKVAPECSPYRVIFKNQPFIEIDGQRFHSRNVDALRQYAFSACINAALANVRSHYLFHAASLCTQNGEGIIIAGQSGLGKSTLTLTLMEKGFHYLSDDVAAIGINDYLLYPFPRSIGIRSQNGTLEPKKQIDISDLATTFSPGSIRRSPCTPCYLFVLSNPDNGNCENTRYLILDHLSPALLGEIRSLLNVVDAKIVSLHPLPTIQLQLRPGTLPIVEPEIIKVCQAHGIVLFEISNGSENAPDFKRDAELISISGSQAVQELLRQTKSGWRSAILLDIFNGSIGRFYISLFDMIKNVECYRLHVGQLDQMVDGICAFVSG